jgi:hypothetical protein
MWPYLCRPIFQLLIALILTTGCSQKKAGSKLAEKLPDRWPSQFTRACLLFGDAHRMLVSASADALAGKIVSESDLGGMLKELDSVEVELQGYPPRKRACLICQVLSKCSSGFQNELFFPRMQAWHLTQSALALFGVADLNEIPFDLRSKLPPEGGPELSRVHSRSCQACLGQSDFSSAKGSTDSYTQACDRLLQAWKTYQNSRHPIGEDSKEDWETLIGKESCARLEACQVLFLQICQPPEIFDEQASRLALWLFGLSIEDLESATLALELSAVQPASRPDPSHQGSFDVVRLPYTDFTPLKCVRSEKKPDGQQEKSSLGQVLMECQKKLNH